MAPISPFFSDALFRKLNAVTKRFDVESIHHSPFPLADTTVIDTDLEERMQLAQDVCSLVLSLRKKTNIKVRQPLGKVMIPVLDPEMKVQLEKIEDLIKAEVNVKTLEYLTETEGIISKKIKPSFQALGKKLGGKMKAVSSALNNFSQQDIATIEKNGNFVLKVEGEDINILLNEVEIAADDIPGWSVANKGSLTVALDITISDELKQEGNAREFVNRIQTIRKESGFELTDRIFVKVLDHDEIKPSLNQFKNYICAEILADSIDFVGELKDGVDIEINDNMLKVSVNKKGH
jgi:isoleucyl-tRNA synthetase